MSGLNVVCLISGGKDSLFSILHCMKNGHKIVALANLHPRLTEGRDAIDDLDSYMYQTIGHSVIPLYEQALGLPLYRQEIRGLAVDSNKCYGPAAVDDETEDLVPLLKRVKAHHPETNAVSTGAILSDYQRTRVESVAVRLGLTPLSYLWQYPAIPPHTPSSLLNDMAALGQDSRIVKVASGGLDESFLWQNVADPRTVSRLERAARRFGSLDDGAVLGEGGEYETLAIAGPSCLWKRRLVVDDADMRIVPGEAGSASLHIPNAHLDTVESRDNDLDDLRISAMLEPQFEAILNMVKREAEATDIPDTEHIEPNLGSKNVHDGISAQKSLDGDLFLSGITGEGSTAVEQMQSILETIQRTLLASKYNLTDVVSTSIILRDMADFIPINPIYGAFFQYPSPPSRVTFACAGVLPAAAHVMVSVTVADPSKSDARKGLHVQSRSYWAPANIGPYSQAVSIPSTDDSALEQPSVVYIAGQIPLIPASMELAGVAATPEQEAFAIQSVLALQHCVRVGRVMQVKQWASAIALILSADSESTRSRVRMIRKSWAALHDQDESVEVAEDPDFDVWDLKYGASRSYTTPGRNVENDSPHSLSQSSELPPLYVIQVDALPRGASIEWVVFGLTRAGLAPVIPQLDYYLAVLQDNIVGRP